MNLGMKTLVGIVTATRRARLVLLLCPCLFFAGASLAQTKADPMHAMAPAQYQRAMIGSAPSLAAAKTSESKTAPAAPAKGTHEGIQVHGHWTIEVSNPDGTVTAHREFENAIQGIGQSYLGGLLGGYVTPGGLVIALNGAHMTFNQNQGSEGSGSSWVGSLPVFSHADSGPCLPVQWNTGDQSGGNVTGTTCLIVDAPTATTASWMSGLCLGVPATSCSANLTFTGGFTISDPSGIPTLGASSGPSVLSGSITVSNNLSAGGQINDVETLFTACDPAGNTSPKQCASIWNPALSPISHQIGAISAGANVDVAVFTQKLLDEQNGDPAPVPYQPGQTIAVTVQISFQ